jgi:hypothetical protein
MCPHGAWGGMVDKENFLVGVPLVPVCPLICTFEASRRMYTVRASAAYTHLPLHAFPQLSDPERPPAHTDT